MAKKLALVTILVAGSFSAQAMVRPGGLTVRLDPAPKADPNLNMPLAQAIVNKVYEDTREKGVVSSYEVAGPRDRIVHLCADECACISKRFSTTLRQYGYDTKTALLRKGAGSLGIKMRGAQPEYGIIKNPTYEYHVVTIVRFLGGWRVVDPVVLQTPTFEPFKVWQKRIESPVQMSVR